MTGWGHSEADVDLPGFERVTVRCIVAALRCDRCGAVEAHVAQPSAAGDGVVADLADELGWVLDVDDLCPDCARRDR